MTLWHYTCQHGHAALGEAGVLLPLAARDARAVRDLERAGVPELAVLVWATDYPTPRRYGLGLTSALLSCDRTMYRYRVLDAAAFTRWRTERASMPALARTLEVGRARPWHWWIARDPVPVVLDPMEAAA